MLRRSWHHLAVRRSIGGAPALQVAGWIASVVVAGGGGLLILSATYQEFMDCSNPELHQSANTTLGWTVATVASAAPVGVSVWLAGGVGRRLPALALAVALASLAIWWWILDADCEWYSVAQL